MSETEPGQKDDVLNRLILDVKALVLLSENDDALLKAAQEGVINSHDEQVVKFMSMIQPAKKIEHRREKFITALGQLILASFLTILGLSLLAPSLMGLQSPEQLRSYFTEVVNGISASSLSNPLIPGLDFIFALLLLLGSFYLLRYAASDLKAANLS
ncbi:MAG: hypothetical protein JRN15_07110 [Nitrososphaerota archaeon]|nr:hypothetical protein [Nitrososphaerota archaeon]